MTVTYTGSVGTASLKAFVLALFRWRGSVWKAVWVELLAWCIAYTIISVCYRTAMNQKQQYTFEDVCMLCYKYIDLIPLTFLLGFYVTQVVSRWQSMFTNLGWCDNFSLYITSYFRGRDERTRIMKRCTARYLILLQVLVFRDISVRIRKRFPTLDSLIAAGFLTEEEKKTIESTTGPHTHYYLPMLWAMKIVFSYYQFISEYLKVVRTARDEGRITNDYAVSDLYKNFFDFWLKEFTLVLFDWVPLPLVYTQVVFITVRFYFLVALLGRQYLVSDRYNSTKGSLDAYVPIFTIFQFIFYVGWMRVAEALLNPFGEDDDDFECNWVIDRNFGVAMKIVDSTEGGEGEARMVKDAFWDSPSPVPMYSSLFAPEPTPEPQGSAVSQVRVPKEVVMIPRIPTDTSKPLSKPSTSVLARARQRLRSATTTVLPAPVVKDVEAASATSPQDTTTRAAPRFRSVSESDGQIILENGVKEGGKSFDYSP